MLKKLSALAILALLAACSGGGAPALNSLPGTGTQSHTESFKLKCFSGNSGTCSVTNNVATLTIPSPLQPGANAGVYFDSANSLKGLTVSQITRLSFDFSGPTNVGGDPRFNIPVTTGTVFIPGNACYSGTGPYTLDAINNNPCNISSPENSAAGYPNWATFTAAEPNLTITGAPYVIIDEPGTWTISNVEISAR